MITELEIRALLLAWIDVLEMNSVELKQKQKEKNKELVRRGKQSAASFVGTLAVSSFTALRSGSTHDVELDFKKTTMACVATAAVSAAVWFFMPRANQDISVALDDLKEQLEPAVKLAATAVLNTQVGGLPEEFKTVMPNYTRTTVRTDGSTDSIQRYPLHEYRKASKTMGGDNISDDDLDLEAMLADWQTYHDPWKDVPGLDDEDMSS